MEDLLKQKYKMQIAVDDVEKFRLVLNEIDQEMVPVDHIKKVVFKLQDGKQKTINLERLKKQGLHIEDIEVVVNRHLTSFSNQVNRLHFVLDVESIAKKIKPLTERYLEKL